MLVRLFKEDFDLCHFHTEYKKGHDFSQMHNPNLDELVFLHNKNLDNERYIYQRVIWRRIHKGGQDDNQDKWYNCLLLVLKRDCDDEDLIYRLKRLPWILRDTSNVYNTIETIDKITEILQEPCATTYKFLSTEVEWRKAMFEALVSQIPRIRQYDEYYLDDVYELMLELPDSLTSNYAYEYIMNTDLSGKYLELEQTIFDIIDYRFKDWGMPYGTVNLFGYTRYEGPEIILTIDKVNKMIERVQEIERQKECDWCSKFIQKLSQRKE